MKNLYNKKWILLLLPFFLLSGCADDLDEELFGVLSPENYYKTEDQALSSVVGVYQRMSGFANYNNAWRNQELGTDEFIVVGRASGGWFSGGSYLEFVTHDVSSENGKNGDAWDEVFGVIGAANAVLQSIEESPEAENLSGPISEVKALRAYAYFYAMDFWGNVPIVTDARIDQNNLPETSSRSEVFDFVVSEMLSAAVNLPSITEVDRAAYYPRFTKESIYAALATIYLNGKVYSGTEHWNDALEMSNKVINSSGYILEPNFIDNFTGDNYNSKELISSFSIDPSVNAGKNNYVRGALHPLHKLVYNLPFTPANGYNTFEKAFDRYDVNDIRRNYILHGPQTYLNDDPLIDPNGIQLDLIPIGEDPIAALDNEGFRVLKYVPDGQWVGRDANNDVVLMRYSDVLLTKAEALFRIGGGNSTEALGLVNDVRSRSNADPLTALSLQDIEDERSRELLWEGSRRRDMIRFGSFFTGRWKFHTSDTPESRGIYPIPSEQISSNPNLVQNPGY